MRNTQKTYRIGEIAGQTGVTAEALRYYEQLGLLPKSLRTDGGARRYANDTIERVRLIKQVQGLGLTLREVLEVLGDSARRSPARCRSIHGLVTRHIEGIDRRVAELLDLRRTLDAYRQSCEGALRTTSEPECPMLDALEKART